MPRNVSSYGLKKLISTDISCMNSLRVEGVFWRILNQIDPDFMISGTVFLKRTASGTDYQKMQTAGFNPKESVH